MPNTLNLTGINPIVLVQGALAEMQKHRPLLKYFSKNFTSEGVDPGYNKDIYVSLVTVPTVQAFGTGPQAATVARPKITVNQFVEIHKEFTPQEYSSTNIDLVEEQKRAIAIAIADAMIGYAAAYFTTGNFTNAPKSIANGWNFSNTIVPLMQNLDDNAVPDYMRFLILNSAVNSALLTDTTITSASINSANGNAIRTGVVPPCGGFEIIDKYPNLPTTGNMIGFAGTPDCLAMATAVPTDVTGYVQGKTDGTWDVVRDPETGMTVLVNIWLNMLTLKLNYRVCWMYGMGVGNANNGLILRTGP